MPFVLPQKLEFAALMLGDIPRFRSGPRDRSVTRA
jgi:hypothetical protein